MNSRDSRKFLDQEYEHQAYPDRVRAVTHRQAKWMSGNAAHTPTYV